MLSILQLVKISLISTQTSEKCNFLSNHGSAIHGCSNQRAKKTTFHWSFLDLPLPTFPKHPCWAPWSVKCFSALDKQYFGKGDGHLSPTPALMALSLSLRVCFCLVKGAAEYVRISLSFWPFSWSLTGRRLKMDAVLPYCWMRRKEEIKVCNAGK